MKRGRKRNVLSPEVKWRLKFEKASKERGRKYQQLKRLIAWLMLWGFEPEDDYPPYVPEPLKFPRKTNLFAEAHPELYDVELITSLRQTLIDKYGKKCMCCGIDSVVLEHIKSRCKGGTNDMNNLQLLCWKCNFAKGHKELDYRPF